VTADDYLRRVDAALRDLPWSQRRELLAELRSHLAELPAGTDLRELGTPEEYASDLRSAAGLERRHGPVALLRARRPRNVILVVLTLTVIGLAIGAVVWIDSYQPVASAQNAQLPADSKPTSGQDGGAVVVHPGRPFEFGITVQNTGRYAVRVVGVPLDLSALPFSGRLLMSGPQKEPGVGEPWQPFQPFDMKPGEIRWLVFKGAYDCGTMSPGGGKLTLVDFPVRFKFLWRTETASIPLGNEQLTFNIPKGTSCPAKR
jgi:hypothetical protein